VVGAPFSDDSDNGISNSGAAFVFTRSTGDTTWSEQAKLMASDGAASDRIGGDVAIAGDTVVVGSINSGSNIASGAVYFFCVQEPRGPSKANERPAPLLLGILLASAWPLMVAPLWWEPPWQIMNLLSLVAPVQSMCKHSQKVFGLTTN